jgi:hypothetical protein
MKENIRVGTNKYRTNLWILKKVPKKSMSKIFPNLLCFMLSKKFFITVFSHQIILLFFELMDFLRNLNQQIQ